MGDKVQNCRKGLAALESTGMTAILQTSPLYKTSPTDFLDQDWFINGVAQISTRCDPLELLAHIRTIEQKAGRKRHRIKFGPRILDLDILLYGREVIDSPELSIPHPRMHQRRFVLKPLCDIDPEMIHPTLNRSMMNLLEGLDENEQKVTVYHD